MGSRAQCCSSGSKRVSGRGHWGQGQPALRGRGLGHFCQRSSIAPSRLDLPTFAGSFHIGASWPPGPASRSPPLPPLPLLSSSSSSSSACPQAARGRSRWGAGVLSVGVRQFPGAALIQRHTLGNFGSRNASARSPEARSLRPRCWRCRGLPRPLCLARPSMAGLALSLHYLPSG